MSLKLALKVTAGSSVDRVIGWYADRLKVSVTAPPEKGKANENVERLMAKVLGLSRKDVNIISGHSSPQKVIEIDHLSREDMLLLLPPRDQT